MRINVYLVHQMQTLFFDGKKQEQINNTHWKSLQEQINVGFRFRKKTFFENTKNFGYSFIKNDAISMYLPFIYKTPIISSLFKFIN